VRVVCVDLIFRVRDVGSERRDELASLLERVSLEAMIGAFKVVTGRLDFLKGLQLLVFDPTAQEQLAERTQLHRILAGNTWIFGEEFNLTVDDKELTKVLEAHLRLLDRDAKGATPVRREDGSVGIVDLMLSRSLPEQKNEREHLVVELKAPTKSVSHNPTTKFRESAVQALFTALARSESSGDDRRQRDIFTVRLARPEVEKCERRRKKRIEKQPVDRDE
jgi:hypothetical protein